MTKKLILGLLLVSLLALGSQAVAKPCTIDQVPAATLLLPYFEVDLDDPSGGITTLFSINNASANATLAHVTLWTDWSIPTLDFIVYLTGFDVQTINVRDIFDGFLPRTADVAGDPEGANVGVGISPRGNDGPLGQPDDVVWPGCAGWFPIVPASAERPGLGPMPSLFRDHVRAAHVGRCDSPHPDYTGRQVAADYGDNIARGYITVDVVQTCDDRFPSDPIYWEGIGGFDNILWGDFFLVEPGDNFAQGMELVHIEALGFCEGRNTTTNHCETFVPATEPGDYTFYARYETDGTDARESLATTYAARYARGGAFDGGTELLVWRDSTLPVGPFPACGAVPDVWGAQLAANLTVAFDEQEQSEELCFRVSEFPISPPIDPTEEICFPLETQRVTVGPSTNIPGADPLNPTANFGWLYLDLNQSPTAAPEFVDAFTEEPISQNWVGYIMRAEGRFSVGVHATQLDNAMERVLGFCPAF